MIEPNDLRSDVIIPLNVSWVVAEFVEQGMGVCMFEVNFCL